MYRLKILIVFGAVSMSSLASAMTLNQLFLTHGTGAGNVTFSFNDPMIPPIPEYNIGSLSVNFFTAVGCSNLIGSVIVSAAGAGISVLNGGSTTKEMNQEALHYLAVQAGATGALSFNLTNSFRGSPILSTCYTPLVCNNSLCGYNTGSGTPSANPSALTMNIA